MKKATIVKPSLGQVKYSQGKNPNSLKNLKPFKPGENGERPGQGYSLTSALRHALGDKGERDKLIKSTIEGAIKRESTSQNIVWDRVDGKLRDKEEIRDINIVFVIGKGYQDTPFLKEGNNVIEQEWGENETNGGSNARDSVTWRG